jgi:hypothetical protein
MSSRNTVFISHGNPEDNEIAGWLAARLLSAGYRVWIDLWHGKGHQTWEEIEEEIRVRSKRVVALVSKLGVKKSGFKDEINAASGVASELNEVGFIIPIRLDDISFKTEVPIQLARLNFIDGKASGWDHILAQLIGQLQKDNIEKLAVESAVLYETWLARRRAITDFVSENPERILSNWYRVKSFPTHIYFYSSDSLRSSWETAAQALKFPKRFDNGILCTFAPIQDVRMSLPLGIKVRRLQKIETDAFLSGCPTSPLFADRSDASRVMVDLVRQGFAYLAISRGLEQHDLSNRVCWFPKFSLLKDKRVKFNVHGFSGSRLLVGKHKEFFWHYATSVDMSWTPPIRITVSGHVIFSIDGEKLIDNAKIAAKLRRQAVRSKRNAWWRDVLLAYISHLAEGRDTIKLPMGGEAEISILSSPVEFISPFKLEFDAASSGTDGPIDDDLLDEDDFFEDDSLGDSEDEE